MASSTGSANADAGTWAQQASLAVVELVLAVSPLAGSGWLAVERCHCYYYYHYCFAAVVKYPLWLDVRSEKCTERRNWSRRSTGHSAWLKNCMVQVAAASEARSIHLPHALAASESLKGRCEAAVELRFAARPLAQRRPSRCPCASLKGSCDAMAYNGCNAGTLADGSFTWRVWFTKDIFFVAGFKVVDFFARLVFESEWPSILINVQANREGGPGHPLNKEPRNIPAAYAGRGIIDTFEFFAQSILLTDTSDGGNCWRDDGSPCVAWPLGPMSTGCSFTATTSGLHTSMAYFMPLAAAKVPIVETPRALRAVIYGCVQTAEWLHKCSGPSDPLTYAALWLRLQRRLQRQMPWILVF